MAKIKRMSVKEFREKGYLQELNRIFLHPVGLALEVIVDNEEEYFGEIWDYRDDPEGILFGEGDVDVEKVNFILEEMYRKHRQRYEQLGYIVQAPDG